MSVNDLPEDDSAAEQKMRFLFALRSRGVTDARVLSVMEQVDRGQFVRGLFAERAYEDMPLPISCGQTISQPSVVGIMTQALNVQPRDTVLEVGTGSGYQAAIMSHLARRVYTVAEVNEAVENMAGNICGSTIGTGGMRSKILAARMVAAKGGCSFIGPGREPEILQRLFAGA